MRKRTQPSLSRRNFLGTAASAPMAAALWPGQPGAGQGVRQRNAAGPTRESLLDCLGGPWPDYGPLQPVVESTTPADGYRLERVTYIVEPGERIAAYLLVPDGITPGRRAPGICVWHQHNGAYPIGKAEPAGLDGAAMHHTGVALAREGYVVLCPDAAGFGERNRRGKLDGRNLEHYLFAMYVAEGKSLAWKNIADMRRAVDYLASRREVDDGRLGCYGHSMGSTHTWLVGPWEPRLKALVANCCLPTYAAMERTDLIHCFPNYIPGWREVGDTPDIAALIAPRALHLNFGETDTGTPIEEVKTGVEVIRRAYVSANAGDRFSYYIEPGAGHDLTEEMSRRMRAHFEKHLA